MGHSYLYGVRSTCLVCQRTAINTRFIYFHRIKDMPLRTPTLRRTRRECQSQATLQPVYKGKVRYSPPQMSSIESRDSRTAGMLPMATALAVQSRSETDALGLAFVLHFTDAQRSRTVCRTCAVLRCPSANLVVFLCKISMLCDSMHYDAHDGCAATPWFAILNER